MSSNWPKLATLALIDCSVVEGAKACINLLSNHQNLSSLIINSPFSYSTIHSIFNHPPPRLTALAVSFAAHGSFLHRAIFARHPLAPRAASAPTEQPNLVAHRLVQLLWDAPYPPFSSDTWGRMSRLRTLVLSLAYADSLPDSLAGLSSLTELRLRMGHEAETFGLLDVVEEKLQGWMEGADKLEVLELPREWWNVIAVNTRAAVEAAAARHSVRLAIT